MRIPQNKGLTIVTMLNVIFLSIPTTVRRYLCFRYYSKSTLYFTKFVFRIHL